MSDKPRTGGGALSNVDGQAFFQNCALQVRQFHSRRQRSQIKAMIALRNTNPSIISVVVIRWSCLENGPPPSVRKRGVTYGA
jgi:hypothetical protein